MGIVSRVIGEAAVGPVEAVGQVLDQLFTSEEEKISLDLARQRLNLQASQVQAAVNQIEASHRSLFIAGWRPFIGWVGGIGLAYVYLVHPLLSWAAAIWDPQLQPPVLEMDHLFELVIAMLGLGGLRTFEKVKGRSR